MRASHVPRPEAPRKFAKMGKRVDVSFLDGIFGFAVISQNAAGNPINRRLDRSMMVRIAVSSWASARRKSSALSEQAARRGAGADSHDSSLRCEIRCAFAEMAR